jgi:hypothetical protein
MFVPQPAQIGQMDFERPPAIGRCRGATAEHGRGRAAVGRHHLERKHPAHERLGIGPEIFVNPAASRLREKNTASVFLVRKNRTAGEPRRATHDLCVAIIGVLIPLLLRQLSDIRGVESNRGFAAAGRAMVAVPLFVDRQDAKLRKHRVSIRSWVRPR